MANRMYKYDDIEEVKALEEILGVDLNKRKNTRGTMNFSQFNRIYDKGLYLDTSVTELNDDCEIIPIEDFYQWIWKLNKTISAKETSADMDAILTIGWEMLEAGFCINWFEIDVSTTSEEDRYVITTMVLEEDFITLKLIDTEEQRYNYQDVIYCE